MFDFDYFAALLIPGIMFPLALVLFGIALWRSQAVARWCGVQLVIAGFLFPLRFAHEIERGLIADCVLLIPALWIGWKLIATPSDTAAAD